MRMTYVPHPSASSNRGQMRRKIDLEGVDQNWTQLAVRSRPTFRDAYRRRRSAQAFL